MKINISQGSYERIGEWLNGDDTGLSSKYLAAVALGSTPTTVHYPFDVGDFGRCARFLECLTGREALDVLHGASLHSPQWRAIWRDFPYMWQLWMQERGQGTCPLLYKCMKDIGL